MNGFEQRFLDVVQRLDAAKYAESLEPTALPVEDDLTTEVAEILTDGKAPIPLVVTSKPSTVTASNLLQHRESHPYVLDLALLKRYGPEWFGWEHETLELRTGQDFAAPVGALNYEKLQAVKTLHYVDTFWTNWEVFAPCAMALNDLFPDFEMMQVPTVAQCAVAIAISKLIREDVPWSDEMKLYLESVHRFNSVLCPTAPLDFVSVDVTGLPINVEEIHTRWPFVRRSGVVSDGDDSVEAEQLRRMLVVHTALMEDRERLRAQLPLLLHG